MVEVVALVVVETTRRRVRLDSCPRYWARVHAVGSARVQVPEGSVVALELWTEFGRVAYRSRQLVELTTRRELLHEEALVLALPQRVEQNLFQFPASSSLCSKR
jgi:hypothetical protein